MDINKLLELVGDNEEAKSFVNQLNDGHKELTQRVNSLEVENNEIKSTRDKYKQGNTLVKELLGVEQINEDTLAKALKKKGGDDVEVQNLQKLLKEANEKAVQVENDYKGKLATYVMKTELAKTPLAQEAYNSTMYGILENEVLKGAEYDQEKGMVVFKNPDGSTLYNGSKPMGLEDKVAMVKSDPAYAPMFRATQNGGSGNRGGGGQSSGKVDVGSSKQEQIAAIQEKYKIS